MDRRTKVALAMFFGLIVAGCGPSGSTAGPTSGPTAAARVISGSVVYGGGALANHRIVVGAVRVGEQGAPAYSTVITAPGSYELAGVADGTYTVFAFIDLGDDMGAPQPGEPQGWYDVAGDGTPDPVSITSGSSAPGVDVTLQEP